MPGHDSLGGDPDVDKEPTVLQYPKTLECESSSSVDDSRILLVHAKEMQERHYEKTRNVDNITTHVISHYETTVSSITPGLGVLPAISNNSCFHRFEHNGDLQDNAGGITNTLKCDVSVLSAYFIAHRCSRTRLEFS